MSNVATLNRTGVNPLAVGIAGAIVGAVAALALSDKKVRERISKGMEDVGHQMGNFINKAEEIKDTAVHKKDKIKEKAGERIDEIVDKTEASIDEIH